MSDGSAAIDQVSVRIAASPESVWDMVSDVTRMGEWSPECYRCVWLGSKRGAGGRFVGFNRRGIVRWPTTNVVDQAERGKVFSFRNVNGTHWRYLMEPDGEGTRLTEQRDTAGTRWWLVKAFQPFVGGSGHEDELRAGMRETLDRIKAAAER
jgi:uncharacterized protein YndB with AHSA1/START domain